jgi:hypothetical protein
MTRLFKLTEKFFDVTWTTPVKPTVGESPNMREDHFNRLPRVVWIRRPTTEQDDIDMERDSTQDVHICEFKVKARSQSDLDAIIEKIRSLARNFTPDTDYSTLSLSAITQEEKPVTYSVSFTVMGTLTGKLVS